MADTYTDRAAAVRATQAAKAAGIANRRDLSDDGRKRQLAKIHADAKTAMRKIREEAAADADNRRNQILRELFGDPESYDSGSVMAYRDALDRAEQVKSAQEAQQLLQRARTTGDTKLARAVAAKALNQAMSPTAGDGWVQVVNDWGGESQHRDKLLTELSGLEQDTRATSSENMLRWSIPRPSGLTNADNVDKLAGDADRTPGEDQAPDPLAGFGWGRGGIPEAG
jgi:hypothetical protein